MNLENSKLNTLNNFKVDYFAEGETIFSYKEPSNGKIYYILDGNVSVKREGFSPSYTNKIFKGNFFGEISLINNFPRNETVTVSSGFARIISILASDFTHTLQLNKGILKKLLDSANNRYNFAIGYYLERKTEILKSESSFESLQIIRNKNIEIIERIHTPNNIYFEDRSTIYRENDLSKGSFFLIEMGQVITKRKYSDKGEYLSILTHEKGDLFGDQSYFGLEHRRERAICSGRVKVREINKNAFETLINIQTDFYLNFIKSMIWKAYILELKIKNL